MVVTGAAVANRGGEREAGIAPAPRSVRRRRRRIIKVVAVVIGVLAALGLVVYYLATTPLSQPCLRRPLGSAIDPVPVAGRASGRSGPITLALAGDAMLGRGIDARLTRDDQYSPWRGLSRALRGVDAFGMNLECAVTDSEQSLSWKKFRFKLSPGHAADVFRSIPVPAGAARFVTVGNNHVLDFGTAGLTDTLAALDAAGIAHAGAGADATSAWRPAVITTSSGVRIGLLAVADHCGCLRMGRWVAGSDQPGIAYANLSSGRWERLLAAVSTLDPSVDVLVASLHAGPNWLPDGPARWQRDLAAALVDAGADVVWSHSSHHVLPLETIRGRTVIYGPGGLVDDYRRNSGYRNDLGMVVRISLAPDGTQSTEVVPIRIERRRIRVLSRDDPDHAEVMRRAAPPPRRPASRHAARQVRRAPALGGSGEGIR
jgi:poly-gamma-glutamate synthesis protein (capsule biosynthesis protein)